MHAGEIEILCISPSLGLRDFAEAGQAQPPRPGGSVLEPDAPTQDRAAPRIGRDLHPRLDPVQRIDDGKTIEARLLDPIVAGAPRRFEADRPRRLAILAHVEEMAARLQRIERAAIEIDRAAAALGPHDEGRAAAVALNLDPDGAVVEDEAIGAPPKLERRAFEPGRRRSQFGALLHHRRHARRGHGGNRHAVGEAERSDGVGHGSAAAGERLRPRPGLVPVRTAGDVKRNEQRRPGAETADAVRNGAGASVVADEPRGRLVDAVTAEKGQVDQGRDPEPHMVEPDQDAKPVIGEQAEKEGQTELPELAGALSRVGCDGDARPDCAVLIVPGRVRRLAQERVDDRRHPQAPAQDANALLDQALDPARADQRLDRPQASL